MLFFVEFELALILSLIDAEFVMGFSAVCMDTWISCGVARKEREETSVFENEL